MNSIYASTIFARPGHPARRPSLLARWRAARRVALARRQLAELPPHLRDDVGLPPELRRDDPDARTFDHNHPVGSPGAFW